jgi:hypothetical protein
MVLMFWLGLPEGTGWSDFRHNLSGPKPGSFYVRDRLVSDPLLFLAGVENGRTLAPPSIVALAIQRGRVVDLEKEFQKLAIAELSRIKIDLDRFGMRSVIGVRCVWDGAACVAHPRSYHTRVSARQLLHTPEAAASKNGSLSGHLTFFAPPSYDWNS